MVDSRYPSRKRIETLSGSSEISRRRKGVRQGSALKPRPAGSARSGEQTLLVLSSERRKEQAEQLMATWRRCREREVGACVLCPTHLRSYAHSPARIIGHLRFLVCSSPQEITRAAAASRPLRHLAVIGLRGEPAHLSYKAQAKA